MSSSGEGKDRKANNGSLEISRKLRVAVKVKLEEMKVKVDPELPDYVIVMISNRKTREEMWECLRNFIGATKASEFTKWLHDEVLNRLMAYSRKAKEKLQPSLSPSPSSKEKDSSGKRSSSLQKDDEDQSSKQYCVGPSRSQSKSTDRTESVINRAPVESPVTIPLKHNAYYHRHQQNFERYLRETPEGTVDEKPGTTDNTTKDWKGEKESGNPSETKKTLVEKWMQKKVPSSDVSFSKHSKFRRENSHSKSSTVKVYPERSKMSSKPTLKHEERKAIEDKSPKKKKAKEDNEGKSKKKKKKKNELKTEPVQGEIFGPALPESPPSDPAPSRENFTELSGSKSEEQLRESLKKRLSLLEEQMKPVTTKSSSKEDTRTEKTRKKKKEERKHNKPEEPVADSIIEDVINKLGQKSKPEMKEKWREKEHKKVEKHVHKSPVTRKKKESLSTREKEVKVEEPNEKETKRKKENKGKRKKKRLEKSAIETSTEHQHNRDKKELELSSSKKSRSDKTAEPVKNEAAKKRKILERASPTLSPKKVKVEGSDKAVEKRATEDQKSSTTVESKENKKEENRNDKKSTTKAIKKPIKKKVKVGPGSSLKIRKATLLAAKQRKVELLAETEMVLTEKGAEKEQLESAVVMPKPADLREELKGMKRRVEFSDPPKVPADREDDALFVDVDPETEESSGESISTDRLHSAGNVSKTSVAPPKTKFTITFGGLDDSFFRKFSGGSQGAETSISVSEPTPSLFAGRKISLIEDEEVESSSTSQNNEEKDEEKLERIVPNKSSPSNRRVEEIYMPEEEELDYDDDLDEETEEESLANEEELLDETPASKEDSGSEEKEEGELRAEKPEPEEEEEEELDLYLHLDSEDEDEDRASEKTESKEKAVDMCTQTSDDEPGASSGSFERPPNLADSSESTCNQMPSLDVDKGSAKKLSAKKYPILDRDKTHKNCVGASDNDSQDVSGFDEQEYDLSAQDPPDSPSITVIKDDESNVIIEHPPISANPALIEAIPAVVGEFSMETENDLLGVDQAIMVENEDDDQLPSLAPPTNEISKNEYERGDNGDKSLESEELKIRTMEPIRETARQTGILREKTMAEKVAAAVASAPSSAAAALAAMKWNVIVKPLSISLEDLSDEDDDEDSELLGTIVPVSSRLSDHSTVITETTAVSATINRSRIDVSLDSIQVAASAREKCRFWPNCRMGEKCRYEHPTGGGGSSGLPCRSFPNCRFGDRCNFVHPICKFDAYCTRPRCAFRHPSRNPATSPAGSTQQIDAQPASLQGHFQVGGVAPPPISFPPLPVPCADGANCTLSECPFNHPKPPCKFGANCSKTSCAFSHPPQLQNLGLVQKPKPLVDTARFKWQPRH